MLKYSRQREAIKTFLAGRYDHPTAETVYLGIKEEFPNISLGTVYRNLSLLSDIGEIQKLSTGIGPDNIDIVINELDALVNIDLKTKEIRKEKRSLNIVRIGTSGSVQADIPVNSFVISEKSIGCDGVLRFYGNAPQVCDQDFEKAFAAHCQWTPEAAHPYVVNASPLLVSRLHTEGITIKGVTLTAVGFYGPQGRVLRLPLAMPGINDRITAFHYKDYKVTNYEMESAAITGLCNLLGHHAATICLIIANRMTGAASADYHGYMNKLITYTLDRLAL